MWKRTLFYGAVLAMGTLALQWLDYQRLARVHSGDIYIFLIAIAFLVLGVFIGTRVVGRHPPRSSDGNPQAQAALGISQSELTVFVPKPAHLAKRGGCWFERGDLKIHLGVEAEFRAARKAHPALLVEDLRALAANLKRLGYAVRDDEPLEGYHRMYVDDPFGNRIELLEPDYGSSSY
jgi:hypothetical protein